MKFISKMIAVAALAFGVASASPQEPKPLTGEFETVTVVTACSQIVVVVITTDEGNTYIVDSSSGIPADALKAAITASDAELSVYEVGCYVTEEPGVMT